MHTLPTLVGSEVILLAEQRVRVWAEVEDLPGGQLLLADGADEALEVEHAVAGLAHVVVGEDALAAARAFGAEASEMK